MALEPRFGLKRQTAGVLAARDLRARKYASGAPRSDCAWRRAPRPSRDISSSSLNTSRPRATPQRAPDAAPPGVGRSAMLRGRGQPLWLQRARMLGAVDDAVAPGAFTQNNPSSSGNDFLHAVSQHPDGTRDVLGLV